MSKENANANDIIELPMLPIPRDNDEVRPGLLKANDQQRFVDVNFGNVKGISLELSGTLTLASIATGSPVDGGTVQIPSKASVVLLSSNAPYTQLTLRLPLDPKYGQLLTITSTVDISNLGFSGATFGTRKPTGIIADVPLRLIFAGQWFNI